jgi:hypothetical protein
MFRLIRTPIYEKASTRPVGRCMTAVYRDYRSIVTGEASMASAFRTRMTLRPWRGLAAPMRETRGGEPHMRKI